MTFPVSPARALAMFVALAATPACESVDEAIDQHGRAAETTLGRIEAVAAAIKDVPLLTGDTVDLGGTKLVIDLSERASSTSSANAAVVYVEDLEKQGELSPVNPRVPGTVLMPRCASYARHRTEPWDPLDTKRWAGGVTGWEVAASLDRCGRTSHLLVMRTVALVRPGEPRLEAVSGSAPLAPGGSVNRAACSAGGQRCAFDGGYARIEVHVFQLSPREHRGGFIVEAESSERLAYPDSDSAAARLDADLASAIKDALMSALPTKIAGARVESR